MPALGLGYQDTFVAHDLITGLSWQWGEHAFVRLGPDAEPVHVIQMRRF
jgi:starch synthase (maltosyl-transferring)